MNMDYEYSTHNSNSEPRQSAQPVRRSNSGKGGLYLKENPKKTQRTGQYRRRRHRRRKLNPRFVILMVALIGILIGMIFLIRSCTKPTIVGRWDMDGTTVYRFEEDGTGALELPIKDYDFTYVIDDDVLKIHFVDNVGSDLNYTFEVQKDTLFLTGGPGDAKTDYALKRVG